MNIIQQQWKGAMQHDARYMRWLIALLIFVELVALSGLMAAPHQGLMKALESEYFGLFEFIGFFPLFSVLYFFSGAPRWEAIAIATLGCIATLVRFSRLYPADLPLEATGYIWFQATGVLAFSRSIHRLSMTKESADLFQRKESAARLLIAFGGMWILSLIGPPLQELTYSLHPATHDLELYKLDAAYGFNAAEVLGQWLKNQPSVFVTAVNIVYFGLTLAIAGIYGLQLRTRESPPVSIFSVLVVGGMGCLLFSYHLYPVTGPFYVFGTAFPDSLPHVDTIPLSGSIVGPAPRNGMPSMHFGWALAAWLMSLRYSLSIRFVYSIVLILTAIATLGLGEHYLVDLVGSFPFMLAVLAVCSSKLTWQGTRLRLAVGGAALFFLWLLMLWTNIALLITWPALLWLASLALIAASIYGIILLQRSISAPPQVMNAKSIALSSTRFPATIGIHALFVVSGAAALMYQVLFAKQLAYVFGSMSAATNTVLATYMTGIAIGSLIGGLIGQSIKRPLFAFAMCELGIGLYCFISPAIFQLIQSSYVASASGLPPDAAGLLLLRVTLGATALIIPTIMMGMTMPFLVRYFTERKATLGVSAGGLYAANTLGAAVGALLAGYLIIPILGISNTTKFVVVLNAAVAVVALRLHQGYVSPTWSGSEMQLPQPAASQSHHHGRFAMALLMVGGFVTLALEVNFIQLLAVVAGNSTYVFSLMLFAFLCGLGLGAEAGRRLLDRVAPIRLLAWLELGLALAILLGLGQIDHLSQYFANFAAAKLQLDFAARETIRGIVCCLIMIPPATFIGALFPAAIECVGREFYGRQVKMLGYATALNTVGNIAGVLIGGFVLLQWIGAFHSLLLLAAICLMLGLFAVARAGITRHPATIGLLALVAVGFTAMPSQLNYDALTTGANVYFAAVPRGQVIDRAESLDGGLTTVNQTVTGTGQSQLTLLTNGKFQGNDYRDGEMLAQTGFALAPLLHVDQRDSALVIGYGTGNTSRVLHDAGFKRLDIADLSADIYRLANRHLASINRRVTEEPNVNAYVTDGRNLLMLSTQSYDLISMEISSIWFAGAASLYSRDFYRLAKRRLQSGGVLQQWMQLHHLQTVDMFYILGSIRSEFRYVWVYLLGEQGVIVASNEPRPPQQSNFALLEAEPRLQETLSLYENGLESVAQALLLDPDNLDRMLTANGRPLDFFVSTDDNGFLEYSTPKGNALDGRASLDSNLEILRRYSRPETGG